MKKTALLFLSVSIFVLGGCNGGKEKPAKQFPKPGAVVAEASMPVEDPLNHFTFSVKIIADSEITSGVYDIDADFGPNYATSKFTMPKGIEDAKPIIRQADTPYTYIIGFKQPGDTTFYEYFEVSSNKKTTQMRYLKSYTF